MSAPTPSSNELSKLRENWASRQGSAKGQYRMSHRDAGILFSEVERLQRAIVDRDRKLAECSIEIFNLESDKKRAAVEPRACCFDAPEGMHHPTCLNIGSPVTRAAEPPDVLRDAERYRYIRSDACGLTLTEDLLFGDRLDMAIDTEMSRAVLTKGIAP